MFCRYFHYWIVLVATYKTWIIAIFVGTPIFVILKKYLQKCRNC